jgi:hypothetical protein
MEKATGYTARVFVQKEVAIFNFKGLKILKSKINILNLRSLSKLNTSGYEKKAQLSIFIART